MMNKIEKTMHYESIVRQEWTNKTTIGAWDKWSQEQAVHCQPLTDALLKHAQLTEGLKVLDLASGVGQPSFAISENVGPEGSVVATDLSDGMLQVAKQNAHNANITNIEFKVADVHQLPFEDNSFDRVVSRLGLMYFWNIEQAISEIYRVLKPGGVASFIVWGANEKNEYFGTILSPFMQRREMATLPDDAPTPTRFGDIAGLTQDFKKQGFSDVQTLEYCEPLPWPGTPKELFEHFYDMAVPLQPYIDSFSEDDQKAALQEIEHGFDHCWDGSYTKAFASFNAIFMTK